MAKPYGDDLRRKFLLASDQGEETLEELADRFLVSVGWAKKISAQRNRTGQAERVPHQPGRKLRAGPEVQRQVGTFKLEALKIMLCLHRFQTPSGNAEQVYAIGNTDRGVIQRKQQACIGWLAKLRAVDLFPDDRTVGVDGGVQRAFRRIDIFLGLAQSSLSGLQIGVGFQRTFNQLVKGRRMEQRPPLGRNISAFHELL